jgi:subtilisin family serine protease
MKCRLPGSAPQGFSPLWLWAVISAGALAAGWAAEGQTPSHPPAVAGVLLRLRGGAYDPLHVASVADAVPPAAPGQSPSSPDLYVVQFAGPIRHEWRQALEATGAAVLEYLPDFAFLVRAAPASVARFAALPGHRWHGAFEPVRRQTSAATLASIARQRSGGRGPALLNVMTFPGEDVRALARQMPGHVVQKAARHRGFLRVSVAPGDAARVAALPGVEWVEPYVPPKLFNDVAAGLMQVPAARQEIGLFGRGQVVAVADTGLDVGGDGVSDDFSGRVRRAYALSRSATGDWSDLNGHGTHVCGSVLGAGALSGSDSADHLYEGSFAGMAPEASLVMQSVGDASGALALPMDLGQLLLPPYQNDGARIHSDSWGSGDAAESGQYLQSTWQIDDTCWQARDLIVVFAAGNGGVDANGDGVVDPNSLSPEATAKNAISVGSSESLRNQLVTWGRFPMFPSDPLWGSGLAANPSGMAAFSSRGPAADGRIKPDVVAPGTWILSARSHATGASALWGAYNDDYAYCGGTSMSAPIVAGATALLREGLQERFGIANPSSALVKAVLLNGADDLAPGQYGEGATREIPTRPNAVEGWGRVDVGQSLGLGGSRTMLPVDEPAGLQTAERRTYKVTVVAGDGPLRITLAWTDPPASLLSGPQLVNDLDLRLLTPDGHSLLGNGGADHLNNVEAIELPQPPPGVYTVEVDGYNVPQGPQPFALAIAGPIQPAAATVLQVSVHTESPALPLAGADLTVAGVRTLTLTSNQEGQIQTQLPAGDYTVTPAKPGWTFDPPSRSVALTEAQTLPAEFTATAATGTLSGLLISADGQPIAGAAVALSPGGLSSSTDANGSYEFRALPPLVYSVSPVLPGSAFSPASQQVRVPIAGSAVANFTTATAALLGTVVSVGPAEPQVVTSSHPVRTYGAQSWTVSRAGARWIRVHFTRIDAQPGVERLAVLDSSGHSMNQWSGPFTDIWSAWVPGNTLRIRYTGSGSHGRYGFESDSVQTDLGGKPVPDAPVALQPGGRATRTDSGGSFRFSGLSGGSFDVAPALAGWQFFPPVAAVTLPAGASDGTVIFLAQPPRGG